jgi:hypothetical protein
LTIAGAGQSWVRSRSFGEQERRAIYVEHLEEEVQGARQDLVLRGRRRKDAPHFQQDLEFLPRSLRVSLGTQHDAGMRDRASMIDKQLPQPRGWR